MHKDKMINIINECYLQASRGRIYVEVIDCVEEELIRQTLEESYGNQLMAARILGINRNTLRTKIKKFNINVKRFKR